MQRHNPSLNPSGRHYYLHAAPIPKARWGLVTSDKSDVITINSRIIAENMTEDNAITMAYAWNSHPARDHSEMVSGA